MVVHISCDCFFYYHGFFVIGKAVVSQEVLHHTGVLPGALPSLLNELLAIRFPLNGAKKKLCCGKLGKFEWLVATFSNHFFLPTDERTVNGKHGLVGLVRVEIPKTFTLRLSVSISFYLVEHPRLF